MSNSNEEWGWSPQQNQSLLQRVNLFLYNPDKQSVLGRTSGQWGVVLAFYTVFYLVLGLMFAACMAGLLASLNDSQPTRILSDSLIGSSPGVAARPREYLTNSSADELRDFLKPYEAAAWFKTLTGCKFDNKGGRPEPPCLYVKVNKVFDWVPQYYEELPEEAPDDLKEYVSSMEPSKQQQVWVSCAAERENISFAYPWGRGLADEFFPFRNQRNYLSPLVAVQVTDTMVNNADKNKTAVKEAGVRCRAWARNIIYNPSLKEPRGYARVLLKRQ